MNRSASHKNISVFIAWLFVFTFSQSFAQQSKIDSLLSVLNSSKADTNKVNTLYYLAVANIDDAKYENAIENARQGIKLSEEIKFKEGVGICLNVLGIAYKELGKLDTALIQFEKQYEIVKSMNDSFGIASTCDNMGIIYLHFGEINKALELRKRANNIYEQQNKMSHLASGYVWIGNIHKSQGDNVLALENYLNALKIYEDEKDEENMGYALVNISSIYRYQKQYDKAIEYAFAAKEKFANQKNEKGVGVSLYRLALIYFDQSDYNTTIETLKDAELIFKKISDAYFLSLVQQKIGNCYRNLGDNDLALNYFKSNLETVELIGDKTLISGANQNIGTIYFNKGNYSQALEYMRKSEKILLEINDKNSMVNLSQNFIEIFSQLNKPDSILKYFYRYQQLTDSLFSQQNSNAIAEMQTKYETEKREKELGVSAIKISNQKSNLTFLTIIVALLLLNSGAMYYVHRKKIQKNLQLAKSQLQLTKFQEAEIKNRVRNSVLDNTTKLVLEKLIHEIEIAKCFTDTDLNITALAQSIGTNREYLSQIIHNNFDKNFNEFINQYRVKESIVILTKIAGGEQENWTMQMVAENSGFKYTSTFNPAFKAAMKMSPAEFKKTLKKI